MTTAETEANTLRTLILAGLGVIALAALVVFVVLPTLGGDEDDGVPADDVDVVVGEPTELPTPDDVELLDPEEPDGDADPPAETFEVFNARDPFQQLVDVRGDQGTTPGGTTDQPDLSQPPPGGTAPPPPPPGGTAPPPTGGTSPPPGGTSPPPDSSNGTGGTGTNGTDGSTGGNGSDGSDGNGSDAQVGGTQVTLVDVFNDDDGERKATVTVNGTGYTVGEGETFGRRFRLLDISGRCATMLFGDSRFTLCEGERIRK